MTRLWRKNLFGQNETTTVDSPQHVFERAAAQYLATTPTVGGRAMVRTTVTLAFIGLGVTMELAAEQLKSVNEQVAEARNQLQETINGVRQLSDVVNSELKVELEQLRATRMAVTAEARLTINALQDIRKFFLEDTYEHEMQRTERLLQLCQQFKQLHDDGTLNALTDVILKLAIKE